MDRENKVSITPCQTFLNFYGSEIQEESTCMRSYIRHLLFDPEEGFLVVAVSWIHPQPIPVKSSVWKLFRINTRFLSREGSSVHFVLVSSVCLYMSFSYTDHSLVSCVNQRLRTVAMGKNFQKQKIRVRRWNTLTIPEDWGYVNQWQGMKLPVIQFYPI